jgi:ceramide glucosyltransferase
MALVVLAAGAVVYLAILGVKSGLAVSYTRRYQAPARPADLAAATIVQPILSGDPDLEAALRHNLDAVPEARFLWLIDRDDAEAAAIAARLEATHPEHRIERIAAPPPPPAVNPKLFKLELARAMVTDGSFVVLDDDTRLTREGLSALVSALETHTLATGLPCYLARGNTFSRLLAQFVNNNAAVTYLPLLAFAPPPTINGMTYALRPATLTWLGGFAPLSHQLADDLAVARRVIDRNGTIVQTPYPQFVATTVRDARHYWSLMHRWFLFALLLMREQSVAWRTLLGALFGLPPVLLWIVLMTATVAASWPSLAIVCGTLAVRGLMIVIVQRVVTGESRHEPILSIASELLQPVHLVDALLRRTIRWRTRQYVVIANDDFRPV